MSKSKSISKKLVATGGHEKSVSKPSQAPSSDFLRAMLYQADQKEAAYMVGEQGGLEFDKKHGGEIERLKLELQEFDARYTTSKSRSTQLEEKIKSTVQFIKSASLYIDGADKNTIRFSQWRRQDQVSIMLIGVALVAAMGMGAANVYANLMASAEPIFIEKPWLAACLSILVPAGSTALKFVSNFFEYARTKKRYALCIYILSALALLIWSICFSLSFTGVAATVDWESIGAEESGKGSLLVWIQICAEMLIAAALFLALEDILNKYAPDSYVENLDFLNASKSLKLHRGEHDDLRDTRNDAHARFAQLNAERQVFINERIAEYLALRARFNSINSL